MAQRRTLREVFGKFGMFVFTSSAGTLVDLGLHWLLNFTVFKSGGYWGRLWIAPTVSFEVATLVNFAIAYFFVWSERLSEHSLRSFLRHLMAYNAACVGAYLIKFVAMQGIHFLFASLGWFQELSYEPVLCNFFGLFFSGCFNFFMSEFVIFNRRKE